MSAIDFNEPVYVCPSITGDGSRPNVRLARRTFLSSDGRPARRHFSFIGNITTICTGRRSDQGT